MLLLRSFNYQALDRRDARFIDPHIANWSRTDQTLPRGELRRCQLVSDLSRETFKRMPRPMGPNKLVESPMPFVEEGIFADKQCPESR